MEIGPIQAAAKAAQTGNTAKTEGGFADMLGDAMGSLQGISDTADQKVAALASGEDIELHEVMLALEAESLSMSFATQLRNKAVEAYQEVFRMNI
jgi:flagellar hook-basal body complex protein FliE